MDDAGIERFDDVRVRRSWERPGRRLRPRLTLDVDAEVAVAVAAGDGRTLPAAGNATPARGGGWAARLWDPMTGRPVGEQIRVWSLAATPAGRDRVLLAMGTVLALAATGSRLAVGCAEGLAVLEIGEVAA
ncbi:hypothetical protein ACTOB_004974 [Actinoplanes oblitus]|uniref:Uncharacterized protein n=1 Tax=Actinoplanes oblitus TaxID=3040509 RepID=A0ABY8W584_9ACTN|nr:hypothetical protein [Actinoplanes oblitus]WIM93009.1 hypothetical protein ACTOB_004974 [Actinoplanes oblitus]